MFEIIYNGIVGLVVGISGDCYQCNFGNQIYDLNKWLYADEIKPIEDYII